MDYPQLAELAGFKTAASATTAYCSIKKKLLSINSANKSANPEKAKSTSGTKEAGKGNQSKKRDSSGKGIMGDEGDIFPVQHNGTSTTDDGDSKPKKRRRTPKKATTSSNDRSEQFPPSPQFYRTCVTSPMQTQFNTLTYVCSQNTRIRRRRILVTIVSNQKVKPKKTKMKSFPLLSTKSTLFFPPSSDHAPFQLTFFSISKPLRIFDI